MYGNSNSPDIGKQSDPPLKVTGCSGLQDASVLTNKIVSTALKSSIREGGQGLLTACPPTTQQG